MQRLLYIGFDTAISAVILIPAFIILNQLLFHNLRRTTLYILFSLYLAAIYSVAGLPTICYFRLDFNYNLIPFAYMFSDFQSSFLNVLLFVPLGLFLPLLWKHFKSPYPTVIFGFFTSLTIEFLQIFTYRATDINDLITNTFGSLLGWYLARVVLLFFPGTQSWKSRDICIICLLTLVTMFFLHPYLVQIINTHIL